MRSWNIRKVAVDRKQDKLLVGEFGQLGWGGNSGFQALNLAVQFGANPVILVGYDMRLDHGVHWHGAHDNGLNNPTKGNVERWRRAVDGAAAVISALGIKVVNASPISALAAYPKMDLEAALAC